MIELDASGVMAAFASWHEVYERVGVRDELLG
jgi:hypothetical protein